MISAAFPPIGGPGVQRSAKFAKFLPAFGWVPTVMAADRMPPLPFDTSLTADLPETLEAIRLDTSLIRPARARSSHWRLQRMYDWTLKRMVPDPMAAWAWRCYRRIVRRVERGEFDLIYSTYSPASNHLVGWLLKRATGMPWVADFRDLWTDDYNYQAPTWRRSVDGALQRRFLNSADAVIAVTDSQRNILAGHAPERASRFYTIRNGVDLDDFAEYVDDPTQPTMHTPSGRFRLTYTGWCLSDRISDGLIDGLAAFVERNADAAATIELRLVGAVGEGVLQRFQKTGLDVRPTGYLDHDEAIKQMIAADALLLPIPTVRGGRTLMSGKVYEYLASGRPILAVGPTDGEALSLVRTCSAGITVAPESGAVADALTTLWSRWKQGSPMPGCNRESLTPYTRRYLAGKLAELLTRVTSNRAASGTS